MSVMVWLLSAMGVAAVVKSFLTDGNTGLLWMVVALLLFVISNQAEEHDKRKRDKPKRSVGICGALCPFGSFGPQVCNLDAGHIGWHQSAPILDERLGPVEPVKWSDGAA